MPNVILVQSLTDAINTLQSLEDVLISENEPEAAQLVNDGMNLIIAARQSYTEGDQDG